MAVAISNPVQELQDELTCSICLDHFKDPVSIECGHIFCRACISRTWRGLRSHFPCPQCRKISKWRFLRPNRLVENVVEIANRLRTAKGNDDGGKQCKKHQEPLKLYCQEDEEEICLVCRESVSHKTHTVIPVEETTKEFKVQLEDRLQDLRKEVANIVQNKSEEQEKSQQLQNEVGKKRKMVTAEFEAMRQLLADQERTFTDRLEKLEKTIIQKRNESMTKLNEKLSSLQKIIVEIEKYIPSRGQTCEDLETAHIRHTEEHSFGPRHHYPQDGTLVHASLNWLRMFTVPVTLDQKTANPNLLVSRNRKILSYEEYPKNLVPYPERFDLKPCILATTGYRSGRRYWEVEVGGGIYWTIGVAKQSVCRKGSFKIEPSCGIYAVGLLGMYTDRYYAFTNPDTLLHPREHPERIGVFLNCDEGYISFYNADSMEHLHTFKIPYIVEKLFPFFCVGALGTELRLDPYL
ncbi:E3 ubiquitin-protein ligase TRIM39-like [Rhinophrynus dorsalis]